jgi:hypothetical protein
MTQSVEPIDIYIYITILYVTICTRYLNVILYRFYYILFNSKIYDQDIFLYKSCISSWMSISGSM